MNTRLKRLLLPLLRAAAKGGPVTFRMKSAAQQALYLVGKATSKSKGGRLRREKKRAAHNDSTKVIREKVFGRAGDVCEACHTGFVSWGATMDHWSSGSGKSQRQAVENCWVLCGAPSVPESCHYLRQRNLPSVELWNSRFAAHCLKHGYPFTPHITHAQLKRSAP